MLSDQAGQGDRIGCLTSLFSCLAALVLYACPTVHAADLLTSPLLCPGSGPTSTRASRPGGSAPTARCTANSWRAAWRRSPPGATPVCTSTTTALSEGKKPVLAMVRTQTGGASPRVVVPLLNRQYDAARDVLVVQHDVKLLLRGDLLASRTFSKAMLHTAGAEPRVLVCATDADHITLQVPSLDLWGIIKLL